jgi:hypothetical protein
LPVLYVADDLATALFALEIDGQSTSQATREITRAIVRWATSRGWIARAEARVSIPTVDAAERLGIVDVIVHRGASEPPVAIEIDSAHKPWSLDKLRHAVRSGMDAIWVRWGDEAWAGIYDEIDVIQLPVFRRRRPASRSDQLTLWR